MKLASKRFSLIPLLLLAGLAVASQARATVLGYPSTDHASFLVEVPSDWEIGPGEAEGDYVHVNSPSGVYLAFRTIPGSEDAIQQAIEESVAFLEENYQNVSVGEPVEAKQKGLEGFFMDGTGKDRTARPSPSAWPGWRSNDGHIGEIWFAAPASDKAGIAAAAKALGSFHAP